MPRLELRRSLHIATRYLALSLSAVTGSCFSLAAGPGGFTQSAGRSGLVPGARTAHKGLQEAPPRTGFELSLLAAAAVACVFFLGPRKESSSVRAVASSPVIVRARRRTVPEENSKLRPGEAPLLAAQEVLTFLEENLLPGRSIWVVVGQRDPRLLETPRQRLEETLLWLEEFLWNQDWAVSFGRQALATAIRHQPRLLYQGVEGLRATIAWLESHGVTDESVRAYTKSILALPYPSEPWPWLELLQLGASGLEMGAAHLRQMGFDEPKISALVRLEPFALLTAATAAGACNGPPYPGYPLTVQRQVVALDRDSEEDEEDEEDAAEGDSDEEEDSDDLSSRWD